ncbi:hypothetical protein HanRHA438_Chr14g0631051 [Helianthus annuus]|uniref:Uncharacterized protein n=1 Tax=Helianthus annuus TaxID=4232 RepID=A0A251SDZ0_HELAN|nr:hypothetical protein HanXRQr2_Chr14g0621181 [Helianthus annuus]KAJ0838561.1 hypothetical protein HanPSC8_Chr14g0596321 [Helianthus annuus]KAJ0851797.1 hypothetical protein HanRHA438_Chr14g0631051 [Helianthus annuus]
MSATMVSAPYSLMRILQTHHGRHCASSPNPPWPPLRILQTHHGCRCTSSKP